LIKEDNEKSIKVIKIVKCLIPFRKMVSPNIGAAAHSPLQKSACGGKVNEICHCEIFVA
jgi:hypothetical protein